MPPAPPNTPAPASSAAPTPPLRVLLVDDGAHRVHLIRHELTRRGHEVVGVIDAGIALHECAARLAPDVVVIDIESPSRGTLEQVATLSASHPRPVVVFAEDDSDEPMQRALRAGVSAYVVTGLQPHRLALVLRVAIARFEPARAGADRRSDSCLNQACPTGASRSSTRWPGIARSRRRPRRCS